MQDTIRNVRTSLTIHFSNGGSYNLPLVDTQGTGLTNYCTSVSLKEQLYNSSNNNIIGNVCGNTLSFSIVSMDKLLISSNEDSAFYGYMDDTAYVEVYCTGDDNVTTYMGVYFVDSWENGASSNTANTADITCVDILSRVKNLPVRKLRLHTGISVGDYLAVVINKLNETLPAHMRILYNRQDLDIFDTDEYDWQIYYNNIDRDKFENILNTIAQCTLSHLWVNRERYLKTDWLLNDSSEVAVSNVSGSLNTFEYGTNITDLDKASGVDVTYIDNVTYEDKELLNTSDYTLIRGLNSFENVKLNSSNIYDINYIEIECAAGTAKCVSFFNYKDSIDFNVIATDTTTATIKVYGRVINEINKNIIEYKDNNNKESLLELTNRLLRKELIPSFVSGLVDLASLKNSRCYAEGLFNPQLKIGDLVDFTGNKLGIDGVYKIIGIELKLGSNYRSKLTLLKTFELSQSVDTLLYDHNVVLTRRINGDLSVNTNDIELLSNDTEQEAAELLGQDLVDLQAVVYGGAE